MSITNVPDTITINLTLFTTTIETSEGVIVVPDGICERLSNRGWQLISSIRVGETRTVIYRKPN